MDVSEPTLTQRVYDDLRRRLQTGELSARTQLVNRTIARQLGTSTIPVREAIHRLASEGLIEYVPGAGAFVRQPDRRELAQLYDLREALEPLAAAEAAQNIASYELDELQAVCDRWQVLLREVARSPRDQVSRAVRDEWLDLDERFHTLLVAATRNRWLEKVLTGVRVVATVFAAQRSVAGLLSPELARRTWKDHADLVEALRARDVDRARVWMAGHIRRGREVVLGHFDRQGAK